MKLPQKIETKRTVIRKFQEDDFAGFKKFMQDEQATKYLLFSEKQKTLKGIIELFDSTIASYRPHMDSFSLAIADKITDCYLGSIGAAGSFGGQGVQVYWSILPQYWGQGYATEAMDYFIRNLFENNKIEKIKAYTHPDNIASIKVAEKIGMKDKGLSHIKEIDQIAKCFVIECKTIY